VERAEDLSQHVAALVEWSALVTLVSLPTRTWVVRQWLDLDARFTAFEGLPIATEVRAFIVGGRLRCWHPYWPADALRDAGPSDKDWRALLVAQHRLARDEAFRWRPIVNAISAAFGSWSVDLCRTEAAEWVVTDMARAEDSYHWPGCKKASI